MQATLDPAKYKGRSPEVHTNGRPVNLPGIYVHKDTGAKFITSDGEEGITQADALMQPLWKDAWEWTAEVPTRIELLKMRKEQEIKDAVSEKADKKAEEAEIEAAVKLPKGGETYDPAV